jgi:hypothetical protein
MHTVGAIPFTQTAAVVNIITAEKGLTKKQKREQEDPHSRTHVAELPQRHTQRNISLIIPHVRLIPLTLWTTPTLLVKLVDLSVLTIFNR